MKLMDVQYLWMLPIMVNDRNKEVRREEIDG